MTSAISGGTPEADDRSGLVTWRELLAEATERLRSSGGTTDPRTIVSEASGADVPELPLVLDQPVTEGGLARFESMLERRIKGEPLQYVVGHWGFRSLDLMVDSRVLIPRPETEQVVEVALAELDRMGGRDVATTVVDLGTGSGAIALSIAIERVRTTLWAVDASPDAVSVARANLAGMGRAAARVMITQGDWFAGLPVELAGQVDLVVTNPPYVPDAAELPAQVVDWEPTEALRSGTDGLDDIRRIIAEAPTWLSPHGTLVCELSPEQSGTAARLAGSCFAEVEIARDLTGRDRALVARRPVRV